MSTLGMRRIGFMAVFSLLPLTLTLAQRPNRGGGARPAGAGNRPAGVMPTAMNRGNTAMANRQPMAQPIVAGQNMNAQNMAAGGRDLGSMAQMMMANYDSDGSGSLNQAELVMALQGLQQLMMQGGGRNINGQAQNQPLQNQQAGFLDAQMRPFGRRGR